MCFSKLCDGTCKAANYYRGEVTRLETLITEQEGEILKWTADYEVFKKSCSFDAQQAATKIVELGNEKTELQRQLEALQALANPDSLIPPALDQLLEFYRSKYPRAEVLYNGRYYATKNGEKHYYPQDVRTFITPTDFHFTNQTKAFKLAQMIKEQKDFHKGCDKLVELVWGFLTPNYHDEASSWGVTEYWNTPQETYVGAPMDCEDHANRLISYCRAAGLPAKMIYNVVGNTQLGGHSTVYYFASDRKWHHLEATSYFPGNVLDTPSKDAPDQLWIDSVWFRFNDEESFSSGIPDDVATVLKKDLGDLFKIT